LDTARVHMNTLMDHLDAQYPHSNAGMLASITPLYQHRFGSIEPVLLMLFAAVGCVLLIAAVNVANLLLARGVSRQKEMATRAALGAARSRLVRQLLTESLLLSLAGGLCGLVVAYFGLHFLLRIAPSTVPGIAATRIDALVVLFTVAVSLVCGMVFGTAPALQVSKVNLNVAFKQSGGRSTAGAVTRRLRSLFLVSEVALALVLVAAAGLLVRSLIKAANVDPGFNPGRILAMDVLLPPSRYTTAQQQSVFFDQAVQRLQALPGVQSAGAAFCPPLVGVCADNAFMLADHAIGTVAELPTAASNIVVPGYLKALQAPLLEGRFFNELDNQESRRVAIVNESFARRYWPNQSALGKQIKEGGPERNELYRTVVGVVADLKQNGMDGKQQPEVFFPVTQFPFAPWDSLQAMTFVVRTQGDPQTVAEPAKHAVQEIDKDLPVTAVRTMKDYMAQSLERREFSTTLLGGFAILALLLAAIGIYGVMSWNVEQRKHEISTRMALGARAADIFKLVLGQALSLTGAGVLLGLAGSIACAHWLSSMVFGIKASDPITFCFVAVLLATVALLASYVPVRRATQIDPAAVLRSE
ncbi:MAG TPA: ADOP family duplicated permease, partial [Terriglobales bacterium]|nr:ADOP family duplicated permease [Terriglobales bacterium]